MENSTSDAIAVGEAPGIFTILLARVADGEEITLTDRGVPVAKMIPVRPVGSIERKRSALRKMDEIASRCRLEGLRIRDLINEGRR